MKSLAIATVLVASILANAVSASAAPRLQPIDGTTFFADIANRGSQ